MLRTRNIEKMHQLQNGILQEMQMREMWENSIVNNIL